MEARSSWDVFMCPQGSRERYSQWRRNCPSLSSIHCWRTVHNVINKYVTNFTLCYKGYHFMYPPYHMWTALHVCGGICGMLSVLKPLLVVLHFRPQSAHAVSILVGWKSCDGEVQLFVFHLQVWSLVDQWMVSCNCIYSYNRDYGVIMALHWFVD